jgi:hypothetical protein
VIFRMTTGSMHPTIAVDDFVLALPRGSASPRVGEIWVFRARSGETRGYAHRIAGLRGPDGRLGIVARGDAEAREDSPVEFDAALARVVAVGRELGRPPARWARVLSPLFARWLLGGGVARADAFFSRAHAALSRRRGFAARLLRRAVVSADLVHREGLAGARARGLLDVAAASRSGGSPDFL